MACMVTSRYGGGDGLKIAFLPDEDDLRQELVSYCEAHDIGRREAEGPL